MVGSTGDDIRCANALIDPRRGLRCAYEKRRANAGFGGTRGSGLAPWAYPEPPREGPETRQSMRTS